MTKRSLILCVTLNFLIPVAHAYSQDPSPRPSEVDGSSIEDFLLDQLYQRRMLVIPECLSHDSYDAIQLPLKLIQRWLRSNHHIGELIIGLERESPEKDLELIRLNRYYTIERWATICPENWGLFSTKQLNEYLFFSKVRDHVGNAFRIFGYENSGHYYDKERKEYILPSQLDTVKGTIQTISYDQSTAPMVIKYAYSRFFRDYLSFTNVRRQMEKNPNAFFIIIIGNAHTLKKWPFNETDHQIVDAYKIDTSRYAHTLGYYLGQCCQPLFVHSRLDTNVTRPMLVQYDSRSSDSVWLKPFFADYYYALPKTDVSNIEEPPLLGVPSASNLSLLTNKRFQFYPGEEFTKVAQNLVYLFTGILPDVQEDSPGQTGPCTFINPATRRPIDLAAYADSIVLWYRDGTFLRRVREDPSKFNHRSLFQGIFRMMKKSQFRSFSTEEEKEFMDYLLAAISVIGTLPEQQFARELLEKRFGPSRDYYFYFRKFYSNQYD